MEPKGAGPGQSCRGCPTPTIAKSQLHLKVLAQGKRPSLGNPGAAASFCISLLVGPGHRSVPNWASWYWGYHRELGQGDETCPYWRTLGVRSWPPPWPITVRGCPGRLRWGSPALRTCIPGRGPAGAHTPRYRTRCRLVAPGQTLRSELRLRALGHLEPQVAAAKGQ